jgi:hypothetical protein
MVQRGQYLAAPARAGKKPRRALLQRPLASLTASCTVFQFLPWTRFKRACASISKDGALPKGRHRRLQGDAFAREQARTRHSVHPGPWSAPRPSIDPS